MRRHTRIPSKRERRNFFEAYERLENPELQYYRSKRERCAEGNANEMCPFETPDRLDADPLSRAIRSLTALVSDEEKVAKILAPLPDEGREQIQHMLSAGSTGIVHLYNPVLRVAWYALMAYSLEKGTLKPTGHRALSCFTVEHVVTLDDAKRIFAEADKHPGPISGDAFASCVVKAFGGGKISRQQ